MGVGMTTVTPLLVEAKAHAQVVPEILRAEIEKPEWQGWWLAAFAARLRQGKRDAVRLYAELLRMVDGDKTVFVVAILNRLGVRDEQEARSLIETARTAGGIDQTELIRMSRELLESEGWTCLKPDKRIVAGGNGNG